jgi:hypothetical protein
MKTVRQPTHAEGPPLTEFSMRSPLLRLAAGLLLLAACDGKKKSPTEYGSRVTPQAAQAPAIVADTMARIIAVPSA